MTFFADPKMKKNLKFYLKGKLSEKELKLVSTSFDVVGDIMIFAEFPKQLAKKENLIGQVILENYKNIKVVCKKTKKYSGKFRTPKLKVIAGEKRKETVARENNAFLKIDVEKVYFSPRLSSERRRVCSQVNPNENILVMFSGSGAYPIIIAKNTKAKGIYGIEINPIAHKYALENVKKNKLEGKIKLFKGDVKKIAPKLKLKFDRILMPLPKSAEKYLGIALSLAKKNGLIHFYDFFDERKFHEAKDKIKNACSKSGRKCRILEVIKCGQYSPGFYRICVDFYVN